jgi:hypothetical protein
VSTFEDGKRAKHTFEASEFANISAWLWFLMFTDLWRSSNESSASEGEDRKKTEGIIVTQGIIAVCPHLRMSKERNQLLILAKLQISRLGSGL